MKKLFFPTLIISSASFSDWGDSYFCEMIHHTTVNQSGEIKYRNLENFAFTLRKADKKMVLTGGFTFDGSVVPISERFSNDVVFEGQDSRSQWYDFDVAREVLLYSSNVGALVNIVATCKQI